MKNIIQKGSLLLLTGILLLACAASGYGEYWPTKAWRTSTPEKEGLDPAVLDGIDAYVKESLPGTSSVLVVRGRLIVFERYYEGDRETRRQVRGITQSVVSAAVGIAFGKGMLQDVDDPISRYLPDSIRGGMIEATKTITVRHLLTHTAGFQGESGWGSVDPRTLRSMLTVAPVSAPGAAYAYNDANPNLLSVIITQVSRAKASSFASRHVLEPLGIRNARWSDGVDYTEGADGLALTSREVAKLGLLYLEHGKWDRKQLIPEEWVASSTRTQVPVQGFTPGGSPVGHGYFWWTTTLAGHDVRFALGWGGQYACLVPDLDIVVVLTGTDMNLVDRLPIVRDFVIPAVTR